MALITIRGRKDPVEIANTKAVNIKKHWIGDGVPKAASSDIVDLGTLTFEYSEIKTIEMQYERPKPADDYNRPLTREEQIARAAMMRRARKNLEAKGLIRRNPKSPFFTK